jgi:CubicO group peptidase (beta-lactamase class C family)
MAWAVAGPALVLAAACDGGGGEHDRRAGVVTAIDSLARLTIEHSSAPGIGLAVVHRGDTLLMQGYGLASVEHDAPVTDRTVFALASATKPMTAAAVLALADAGRLDLDAPVAGVLPGWAALDRRITTRHLLAHTSGLPDYIRNPHRYREQGFPLSSMDLRALVDQPLQFEPGTRVVYSNSGYVLLGEIIEAGSWPETYPEVLARLHWEPLGMASMHRCDARRVVPGRAVGYARSMHGLVHVEDVVLNEIGSDGALCGTARDVARWIRALFGGALLEEASLARMIEPTRIGDREARQGYGIRIRRLDERHLHYWHTGGMPGFTAIVAHYPDPDLTIVAFSNGPLNLMPLQDAIARLVLDGAG